MELDSSSQSPPILVVRIPQAHARPSSSSSSTDSPLTGSPTMSILAFPNASDSSSSTESAGLSPTTTLNVRFAPLPDLSKRKKRYHQPLGVAARSEIMRKRKAALAGAEYGASGEQDPTWSESDGQHQHHRHHRSHPRRTIMGDNEEELLEDPFITLGKMVKGASKSLWRKVSHKRTEKGDEGEEGGRKSLEVEVTGDEPGKNGQKDAGETIAGEVPSETLAAEARRERKTSSRSSQDAPSSPLLLGDALDGDHGGAGINAYKPHHILRIDGFSVRHGRSCLSLVDRDHFFDDHTRRPGHNRCTRDCGRPSDADFVRDIVWNNMHFNIFRSSFAAASVTANYHAATAHTTVTIRLHFYPSSPNLHFAVRNNLAKWCGHGDICDHSFFATARFCHRTRDGAAWRSNTTIRRWRL
ncbi:hypothetical protein ONZ45_g19084 [Pleurotus djamor]|nr:hypothetical protein ONZ45_g19084 [Pleurotus djamor]